MTSFYWHDYETWGVNPARHRASQFAGLRTDGELNEIGEPLVMYCQPPADDLPDPEACLITGITPQRASAEGLREKDFIAAIHKELAAPGTCGVGYNSVRFDDEVTRYTLYRNFYDPYAREWQNGNSRWDLLDVVRTCYALRPDGIQWPEREEGGPSFRLEDLSRANGLEHLQAHDALSDVRATLAMARLIRDRQPRLFAHLLALRSKHEVSAMIDLRRRKPLLHVSGMFPAHRGCAGLVVPLAMHPRNRNGVICFDLSADPRPLLELEADALRERVFSSQAALGDLQRVPLKLIHLNRCPVVLTPKLLDDRTAHRLQLDRTASSRHYEMLQSVLVERGAAAALTAKLHALYAAPEPGDDEPDVDAALYGGFLPEADRDLLPEVRALALADPDASFPFQDGRMTELLFRYRAHNAPERLAPEAQQRWVRHCKQRIEQHWGSGGSAYLQRLEALRQHGDQSVLAALREWFEQRRAALQF